MGMFDYITCEQSVPGYGDLSKYDGQTKRFFRTFARLAITREGNLIERQSGIHQEGHSAASTHDERQLPFHGDLVFSVSLHDKELITFVARFTDGILASIRPFQELSELEQMLAYTPME